MRFQKQQHPSGVVVSSCSTVLDYDNNNTISNDSNQKLQYQQSNLLFVDNMPDTPDFFPISEKILVYLHNNKLYDHSGNLLVDKQINKIQCINDYILVISIRKTKSVFLIYFF